MSWDEAFSLRYDEWAAKMTADVPFYVERRQVAGSPGTNEWLGLLDVACLTLESLHLGARAKCVSSVSP